MYRFILQSRWLVTAMLAAWALVADCQRRTALKKYHLARGSAVPGTVDDIEAVRGQIRALAGQD